MASERDWTFKLDEVETLPEFVTPAAADWLPLGPRPETPRQRVECLYETLVDCRIGYARELFDPELASQRIRAPRAILGSPREGTCLDLAVLFCGLCEAYDVLPLLIVLEGHALVAVSLEYEFRRAEALDRPEKDPFCEEIAFKDAVQLREWIDSEAYLAIECTGFAQAAHLPREVPEGRDRSSGFLSFDRAVAAGREQLDAWDRPLQYVIDIAMARIHWGILPRRTALPEDPPDLLRREPDRFTDRQQETEEAVDFLRQAPEPGRTELPIFTIVGMPGVGKSALGLHVAHRIRRAFSDACLYRDLRGADEEPVTPEDALAQFLLNLGVPEEAIRKRLGERIDQYRTLLTRRRALVFLDNAESQEQVEPLLPGGPPCVVLITSREPLGDLPVRLQLCVMEPADALALLRELAGAERVDAEADAAREIADRCGHLPLALRIAGATLDQHPGDSLAEYASELAEPREVLDELELKRLSVRASFDASYRRLETLEKQLFRWLALLPAPDFDRDLSAVLLDVPRGIGRRTLRSLMTRQLLEPLGRHRCHFHDLVREFARERLAAEEDPAAASAARLRAARWFLAASEEKNALLHPGALRPEDRERVERQARSRSTIDPDLGKALDWFEAERLNLLAAVEWAVQAEEWDLAWSLSWNLASFLNVRGYWDDWGRSAQLALTAARRAENRYGEAVALASLGIADRLRNRLPEAMEELRQSLRLRRELDDESGEALVLAEIGIVLQQEGDLVASVEHLEQSLDLYRRLDDPTGICMAQNLLGNNFRLQGKWPAAVERFEEVIRLNRELEDPLGQAIALNLLSNVYRLQGRWRDAIAGFEKSLEINRAMGNRYGAAIALGGLGNVYRMAGRWDEAIESYQESLALSEEIGERRGQSITLNNYGLVLERRGAYEAAAQVLERSLGITEELRNRHGQSIALRTLAEVRLGQGLPEKALSLLEESHRLAADLKNPRLLGQVLNSLGMAYASMRRWSESESHLERALSVVRGMGDRHGEGLTRKNLGSLYQQWGRNRAACEAWRKAVAKLQGESPEYREVVQWLEVHCH